MPIIRAVDIERFSLHRTVGFPYPAEVVAGLGAFCDIAVNQAIAETGFPAMHPLGEGPLLDQLCIAGFGIEYRGHVAGAGGVQYMAGSYDLGVLVVSDLFRDRRAPLEFLLVQGLDRDLRLHVMHGDLAVDARQYPGCFPGRARWTEKTQHRADEETDHADDCVTLQAMQRGESHFCPPFFSARAFRVGR